MYLRRYERTKDGKTHIYFALVESVRTERGPRQRVVAQLGELSEDQRHRWQQTAILHTRERNARQLRLFDDPSAPLEADVVRVRLGKVGWTNARAFGDVWLALQLWQMLGLDRIVERHLPAGRETVPPASMVAIEVISRLCIGQGGETSEFGLAEVGYRRTALEDLLGVADEQVTKDRLYRTLDLLLAAKDPIERDAEGAAGHVVRPEVRSGAVRSDQQFFRGSGGGYRSWRAYMPRATIAAIASRSCWQWLSAPKDFLCGTKSSPATRAITRHCRRLWRPCRKSSGRCAGSGSSTAAWQPRRACNTSKDHQQPTLVGTPKGMLQEFDGIVHGGLGAGAPAGAGEGGVTRWRGLRVLHEASRTQEGTSHAPMAMAAYATTSATIDTREPGQPQGHGQGAAGDRPSGRTPAGGLVFACDGNAFHQRPGGQCQPELAQAQTQGGHDA